MKNGVTLRLTGVVCLICIAQVFLGISSAGAQSPPIEWLGANPGGHGNHVLVGNHGSIYNVGSFQGAFDLDPGIDSNVVYGMGGAQAVYLQKMSRTGDHIWTQVLLAGQNFTCSDFTLDADDNLILVGLVHGGNITVDFDPSPGLHLEYVTQSRGYILSLDSTGDFNWVQQLYVGYNNPPTGVATDLASNSYITGTFDSNVFLASSGQTVANTGAYVAKFTSAGSLAWLQTFGQQARGNAIACDTSGQVIWGGAYWASVDFDPGAGTAFKVTGAVAEPFICGLDSAGNFNWVGTFDSPSGAHNQLRELAIDQSGHILLTGTGDYTLDLDPSSGVDMGVIGGWGGGFAVKLSTNSNQVWGHGWSEPMRFFDIAGGPEGNSFIAGRVWTTSGPSALDLDPTLGVDSLYASSDELVVLSFDSLGGYNWGGSSESSGQVNPNASASGLAVDFDGNIYVTGSHADSVDLDPSPNVEFFAVGSAYLMRLGACLVNGDTVYADACDEYLVAQSGESVVASEIFTDTIHTLVSCDTTVVYDVVIRNSVAVELDTSVCFSYTSPSGLYQWDTAGTYTDILVNQAGCDSVITINLQLASSAGEIDTTGCSPFNAPSGLYQWDSSGTYTDILVNQAGCDSVLTIHLQVDTVNTSVNQQGQLLAAEALFASYQWLDCENAFAPIDNAIDSAFSPDQNGVYAIQVTQAGCIDTSLCYSVNGVSTGNRAQFGAVSIVPNPVAEDFVIQGLVAGKQYQVVIFNVGGGVVEHQTINGGAPLRFDPQHPAGQYFLRLTSASDFPVFLRFVHN